MEKLCYNDKNTLGGSKLWKKYMELETVRRSR